MLWSDCQCIGNCWTYRGAFDAPLCHCKLHFSDGFLIWSLVAYRLLPDHAVDTDSGDESVVEKSATAEMPKWKENLTIALFAISVVGMMLMSTLGEAAYVIPGLAGAILLIVNVLDFKEVRDNMGAPVILMMAGVIGVADALANSGFTVLIGDVVADALGTNIHPFLLIFIFALLTSTCATFTGSNMGSVYILHRLRLLLV